MSKGRREGGLSLRFIHTADWHLGRLFHGVHLTEDQAHVLDQLVDLVREARADALLVAGDIYDRSVPPPEAVALLDDVLSRIVLELGVPVVLIAGNHDSPERLGFGARLLAGRGFHVRGTLEGALEPVIFEDAAGPVHLYGLPYAEPAVVRGQLGCEGVHDPAAAMEALVARVRVARPQGARAVLMAHAYVAGAEESESERPLSLGGAGAVEAASLAGFHYVALGHLHRPQRAGGEEIQYAGSLMKYSFSEADHVKSVNLVELDAGGGARVERVRLAPRRDVRRLAGRLEDLLRGPGEGESREDYLEVSLLDDGPVLDPMGKLREVYPNVLHVTRPGLVAGGELAGVRRDHRQLGEGELFAAFYAQVTGEELGPERASAFAAIVDELRRREREAS